MKSHAQIREALDALRSMQAYAKVAQNPATVLITAQIEALRWVIGEGAGQPGSIDEAIEIVKEDEAERKKAMGN